MATPLQKSALDAVRLFRTKEIAGLYKHLRKFGPLPEPPASASAAPTGAITLPNPFLPKKHPKARKWIAPKYSLRRQAELVKKAQASGTLDLLPPGPKKFAAELRAERVKSSLPLAQRELEEKMAALKIQPVDIVADRRKEKKDLEKRVSALGTSLESLREILQGVTAEYDVGQLESFEAESTSETITAAEVVERREAQRKRTKNKLLLENRVKKTEGLLAKANKKLAQLVRSEKKVENTAWKEPVVWAGAFKAKKTPGSELGTRLYTGKKRMFKGHLWERKAARRARRHTILLRDMPARLERYKSYYKKRRPNPLRPSRYTKPPKLPF